MNHVESNWYQEAQQGWGTVEYGEFTCSHCGEQKGMIFFTNPTVDKLICAACWWKFTPDDLGLAQEEDEPNKRVIGVKPATIVQMGKITVEELETQIQKTHTEHAQVLADYHKIWYEAPFTWPYTHFLGVGMMKCPNDLWMYQSLMTKLRPKTIIETGTYQGASALWFAFLMDMLRIDGGKVFTVDFEAYDLDYAVTHPRITFLHGNSVDPLLVQAIKNEMVEGPLLVCLDSDHSSQHVQRELELYAPLCKVGDWLVVEDTNIGWTDGIEHKVTFGGDLGKCTCGVSFLIHENARVRISQIDGNGHSRSGNFVNFENLKCPNDRNDAGARGGVIKYMDSHPGEWRQDILSERYLLTMNPGGWLQRVGECNHV